jgi:hypothetical protein
MQHWLLNKQIGKRGFVRSPFQYTLLLTPKPKPVTGSDEKSGKPVMNVPSRFFKRSSSHFFDLMNESVSIA